MNKKEENNWRPEEHITFEEPRPVKLRLYIAQDGCEAVDMHDKGFGMVESARPATVADLKAAGFVPYAEFKALSDALAKANIIGGRLSNVAFNLSQDGRLDVVTKHSLDEARKAWDERYK